MRTSQTARAIIDELLARSRNAYVPPWSIVGALVALGEKDEAMKWIEKGIAERSNGVAYLVANPEYDALRGDPRYEAILTRVGLK